MSDIITRFKLETTQYDSQLRNASKELSEFTKVATQAKDNFDQFTQKNVEAARSLGSMQTSSRNTKDQVKELVAAFNDAAKSYNQLTDEQKSSDFGKAMSSSLQQLQGRIKDAKQEMDGATSSLEGNTQAQQKDSSALEALTSKLGINIKSLAGWGAALGAGKVALQVLGDSFMSNETNVDDWGRTMQASESLYNGFVLALNNGDFGGFVNGINTIVSAAKDAYNALDELGTRMTIINPERAKLQARQTELRATIREKGANSAEGKAAQQELKQMQGQLTTSFNKESQLNYNAFQALVKQRLAEGGITLNKKSFDLLMKSFSDDNTYQSLRRGAKGALTTKFVNYNNNGTSTIASAGQYQTVDTRNTNQKLMDLFTDEWRQKNSGYLTAAFSAQGSAASNALANVRYTRETTTGGGKGGSRSGTGTTKQNETELQQNQKKINELQQQYVDLASKGLAVDDERLAKLREKIDQLNTRNEQLKFYAENAQGRLLPRNLPTTTEGISKLQGGGVVDMRKTLQTDFKIDEKSLQKFSKAIERQGKEQQKEGSKEKKALSEGLGELAGGLGQFDQGFKQLGIDLGDGFSSVVSGISGVVSILTAISTILSAIEAISAVDAIIPFKNGGIVPHAANGYYIPGNNYSGDVTPIMANAGELVLNKAAQGNLASQLQNGGIQNIRLEARVNAEQILLVSNNRGRRTGKGEIVQSNRYR